MTELDALAARIGTALKARGETVAVAESSAGGLISAALLAQPGASAWYIGGTVVYTWQARTALLGLDPAAVAGLRSSTEPYTLLLARTIRSRLETDWGLAETGAAGPAGNRYGDAAGHACCAIASARGEQAMTIETGKSGRADNMAAFAAAALTLLARALEA